MRTPHLFAICALAAACGGKPAADPQTPASGSTSKYGHSAELGAIMKNQVNQPFSALMFLVYHSAEQSSDGQPDFTSMMTPAATLRSGIERVKHLPDPPVESDEAKEVFMTFVASLSEDSETFSKALARRDKAALEDTLNKISKTCNNCHHFFRLDIKDAPEK